jgi:hypothetical protein
MRRGSGFRFLALLVLVGLFAAVTAGAYGAGYAAAGGTGATPWGPGLANGFYWGGFHIFGFLFTIFALIVVFAIVRAVIWGHPHRHWGDFGPGGFGPGGPGSTGQGGQPGPGNPGDWSGGYGWHGMYRDRWQARQAMLEQWHRQAHGDAAPGTPGQPGTGGPTSGSSAGPTAS